MRSGSTTLRSAGVAAVLALAAPCTAALADDSAQVGIAPPRPAPGGGVKIPVPGCHDGTATVTSEAFLADAEASGGTGPGTSEYGQTQARSDTTPETFGVSPDCGDRAAGRLDAVRHRRAASPEARAGGAHEAPVPPVRGGGGTAAPAAADGPAHHKDTGPGRTHTVVGLVLAGAAAVAVAVRSTRRRRTGAE
ncbi:hypothetical protein OHS70_23715 [Streptomyces sp. NBC_00390]|uniref:hypothetical protein n=1 Tax=Streptomyces sp. NBC_00390 TaxID=2975736 RepID=UPI002E1BCEF0